MSMDSLCATCDICTFMPKQKTERTLVVKAEENAKILFIDDATERQSGIDMALVISDGHPFDYTKTIRCSYKRLDLEKLDESLQRCSVWTKNVVGNYSIYVATKNALRQLGTGLNRNPGDAFISASLGLVLCVEPLGNIEKAEVQEYRTKLQRLFKKAGMK